MPIYLVTGTPGTGKTTLAKRLASHLKATYVDVHAEMVKARLHDGYDRSRRCYLLSPQRMRTFIQKKIRTAGDQGIVIDSHLSHLVPHSDLCIVTTCDIKTLRKRLTKRGYHKKKIDENIEAEIFDVCKMEALETGHKVLTVETSKRFPWSKLFTSVERARKSKKTYHEFP